MSWAAAVSFWRAPAWQAAADPHANEITGSGTFYRDVLDGEAEDDGPDHSKGHLGISVDDFCTQTKLKSLI